MYTFTNKETNKEYSFPTMHEALHEKREQDKEAGKIVTSYPLYKPEQTETWDNI